MQTACVVLISVRAKAETDAAEAERLGFPAVAAEFRVKARMASDIEAVLRRRMQEGRNGQ
jgi:hypothetical protein